MASIHRDPRSPQGVWYAAYRYADGRAAFRSTRARNKRQAQVIADALEAAEREARTGEIIKERVAELLDETLTRCGISPTRRTTAKGWLEEWLSSKEGQVTGSTWAAYSQAIWEFLEYLGPKGQARKLETITEADIEGFVRLLRSDGRSASTINKLVRKYLSAPFEKARKTGKISYNPIAGTSPEKAAASTKGTFSGEQIAALLKVASPDWQGAILFAYNTGARLGDVANLRWSALDVTNGIVVFREQKTASRAVIGLHPDFLDWLAMRLVPESGEAPVFHTLFGKPLRGEHGLSNTFVRLLERAGIENRLLRAGNAGKGRAVRALSFHSFRHTAASNVFNQASLREITRRVTNHAAGGVVDRYIHEDLEAIRAAVNLIPRLPK
jgi:integrase